MSTLPPILPDPIGMIDWISGFRYIDYHHQVSIYLPIQEFYIYSFMIGKGEMAASHHDAQGKGLDGQQRAG